MPLIEAHNLVKTYTVSRGAFAKKTTVHAVDDVDISADAGEIVALVGESGSGKSTIGRVLTYLTPRDSGSIALDGRDADRIVADEPLAYRRAVQIIFQDTYAALNPRHTVAMLVSEGPLIHGRIAKKDQNDFSVAILEKVGLGPDTLSKYPHQFSGGQRQRIMIARALALGPRLIVADEPVSALDVSMQAQIVNLIAEIRERDHVGFLFISHDLNIVRFIADRVVVMYAGVVVEEGRQAELFANPLHPYTANLIASNLYREGALGHREEIDTRIDRHLCRYYYRCTERISACNDVAPQLITLTEGRKVRCLLRTWDHY